jgi:hypothetical protein
MAYAEPFRIAFEKVLAVANAKQESSSSSIDYPQEPSETELAHQQQCAKIGDTTGAHKNVARCLLSLARNLESTVRDQANVNRLHTDQLTTHLRRRNELRAQSREIVEEEELLQSALEVVLPVDNVSYALQCVEEIDDATSRDSVFLDNNPHLVGNMNMDEVKAISVALAATLRADVTSWVIATLNKKDAAEAKAGRPVTSATVSRKAPKGLTAMRAQLGPVPSFHGDTPASPLQAPTASAPETAEAVVAPAPSASTPGAVVPPQAMDTDDDAVVTTPKRQAQDMGSSPTKPKNKQKKTKGSLSASPPVARSEPVTPLSRPSYAESREEQAQAKAAQTTDDTRPQRETRAAAVHKATAERELAEEQALQAAAALAARETAEAQATAARELVELLKARTLAEARAQQEARVAEEDRLAAINKELANAAALKHQAEVAAEKTRRAEARKTKAAGRAAAAEAQQEARRALVLELRKQDAAIRDLRAVPVTSSDEDTDTDAEPEPAPLPKKAKTAKNNKN